MQLDTLTHFCSTLIHPDGPHELVQLNIAGCELGAAGASKLCDALIHPDGPKHLTSLNLASTLFECINCVL